MSGSLLLAFLFPFDDEMMEGVLVVGGSEGVGVEEASHGADGSYHSD